MSFDLKLRRTSKIPRIFFGEFVCAHLGSNQGPSDYESDALTG